MPRVYKAILVCVLALGLTGCAAWPKASPDFLNGSPSIQKVHVLPARITVHVNLDESQNKDFVNSAVEKAHGYYKTLLQKTLHDQGYHITNEIFVMQNEKDIPHLNKLPEVKDISEEMITAFAQMTNQLAQSREKRKTFYELGLQQRISDLNGFVSEKPDAYLVHIMECYLESRALRSSRITKEISKSILIGVGTLGMVIPVADVTNHSFVKYFTGLFDAKTGQMIYYGGIVYPQTEIVKEDHLNKVVKSTYKKLPSYPGKAA